MRATVEVLTFSFVEISSNDAPSPSKQIIESLFASIKRSTPVNSSLQTFARSFEFPFLVNVSKSARTSFFSASPFKNCLEICVIQHFDISKCWIYTKTNYRCKFCNVHSFAIVLSSRVRYCGAQLYRFSSNCVSTHGEKRMGRVTKFMASTGLAAFGGSPPSQAPASKAYSISCVCDCKQPLKIQKSGHINDLFQSLPVCFELIPAHAVPGSNQRCPRSGGTAVFLDPRRDESEEFKPVPMTPIRNRWLKGLPIFTKRETDPNFLSSPPS
jgi:hypothetical protein